MDKLFYTIIPTLVCGIILWYIKRYFDKRDKKEEEREKQRALQEERRELRRIQHNALLLKGVSASLSLGEATAEAIETQHWNGEMSDARVHAKTVKRDIEEFICQQASVRVI